VFLTNNLGYYFSLRSHGVVYVYIDDIATSFKGGANSGGNENDVVLGDLWTGNLYTQDSSGAFNQRLYVEMYGAGKLKANLNNKGVANMNYSVKGADYGEFQNSDDGVCQGSFKFSGKGTAPTGGIPFSLWWWAGTFTSRTNRRIKFLHPYCSRSIFGKNPMRHVGAAVPRYPLHRLSLGIGISWPG
jgi:hypothetical protein